MFVVFFICGFACTCDDDLDDHDDGGSGSTCSFDDLLAPVQVGLHDFGRISKFPYVTQYRIENKPNQYQYQFLSTTYAVQLRNFFLRTLICCKT